MVDGIMTWRTSITTAFLNKDRQTKKGLYCAKNNIRWRRDESMDRDIREAAGAVQNQQFLTCLAGDQIADEGAAVNTVTLQNWVDIATKLLEFHLCFI